MKKFGLAAKVSDSSRVLERCIEASADRLGMDNSRAGATALW
jgi:hypothetical protein